MWLLFVCTGSLQSFGCLCPATGLQVHSSQCKRNKRANIKSLRNDHNYLIFHANYVNTKALDEFILFETVIFDNATIYNR